MIIVALNLPKLLPAIDEWSGKVASELEIEACLVGGADFGVVKRLEVEGCKFSGTQFAGTKFDKLQMSDVVLERIEAAGMHASEAACLRIEIKNSRLTGVDLGAGLLEDCTFANVKFDEAGLRFATLKRVKFEDCVLNGLDFTGAKLSNVSFTGCGLDGAIFDNAVCKNVDLRGENLSNIKDVHGLKGATVSSEQLIQLAPLLAAEAGLDVDYGVE